MLIKENIYNADKDVLARANSVNFYTLNEDSTELKKAVFVRIKNPRIAGSAYWFDSGIEVGVGTSVGYTTGAYVYQGGTKYIEIELLLPAVLSAKYNKGAGAINSLLTLIKRDFKYTKKYKGCTLLTTVPTRIWVQEDKFTYADKDGTVKSYIDENETDPDAEIISTDPTTDNNDDSDSESNSMSNNTTMLLVAVALFLLGK